MAHGRTYEVEKGILHNGRRGGYPVSGINMLFLWACSYFQMISS